MSQDQYVIRGGADGRERLRIMSHVLESGTDALFERVGVTPGWSCVDVGCGGGDVTMKLAALVGSAGYVVGFDIDSSIVAIAEREAADRQLSNVSFHNSDANSFVVEEPVDLIYSRFLLTHLPDPARVLRRMMQALKPGGVLIVEDIDFSGHFFYPESSAFRRFIELYRQIVHKRGGDPTIGLRLPTERTLHVPDQDTFALEITHFLHCIRHGDEPITSARSQRRPLELVLAAYKSMQTSLPVNVAPTG